MKCSKCGSLPKESDQFAWRCNSCKKVYRVSLKNIRGFAEKKQSGITETLLKCKECGAQLDDGNETIAWKCSCGNVQKGKLGDYVDENMEDGNEGAVVKNVPDNINPRLIKCSNCGREIEEDVLLCSNCGCTVKKQKKAEQNVYKRCIGIAMCIIGCILFIVAITKINNDKYKFYLEHYETCMQGYDENAKIANTYTSGFFNSSYKYIASGYKEMAEDAYKEIWKYRIEAIVACGAGLTLLVIGYKNVKNKRDLSSEYIVKKEKSVSENKKKYNMIFIGSVVIVLVIVCVKRPQLFQSKNDDPSYGYSHYDSYFEYPETGNKGALKKAKSYLNSSAFSYKGLVDQLEYEGFTPDEAKYGVDNCNADWKEQAVKKAASYLNSSSFSRSELIDQLEYEGFTYEQAVYGVEKNGL